MHFGAYSEYYDLLYHDKDYEGESKYIDRILRNHLDSCSSVLELGCGTGKHASLLANMGYQVTGVELSETMIAQAQERSQASASHPDGSFEAVPGDARTFRNEKQYDAVVSLFHVVSYQTDDESVIQMFETAREHLRPGGIFFFDVWYGPAVVSQRPDVRVKRLENDSISVVRIAEPQTDLVENRVDVNYTVFVTEKNSSQTTQLTETHPMRYFFPTELKLFAERVGLRLIHSEEWLTSGPPSADSWGVTFIVQRPGS